MTATSASRSGKANAEEISFVRTHLAEPCNEVILGGETTRAVLRLADMPVELMLAHPVDDGRVSAVQGKLETSGGIRE
jgi:uncharacterized protein YggU (UPF0235/DUF167 family)